MEILSFYTCVPQMTIIYMMYGSWDIEHNRQNVLSFWAIFCSFIPLKTWVPKMKIIWCMISEIWSTTDRIFIILDYLLPIIKYMAREIWSATDRIFLSSWAIFCPFTPLTAQKMKISKNWKKLLQISSWSYAILFLRYGVWQM